MLLKTSFLTLILLLFSNISLATKRSLEADFSDSKRLKTNEQIQSQYNKTEIVDSSQDLPIMMSSPYFKPSFIYVYSYLGRQEIGRMQQASKIMRGFLTEGEDVLQLWKGYAEQLQLEIKKDIKFVNLISQIKDYYKPQINFLFNVEHPRFKNINVCCSSFNGSVLAGYAHDSQNNNQTRAIILKDGGVEPLSLLNNGNYSIATAISADGTIITGQVSDDENNDRKTAVIWKNGNIKTLGKLNHRIESNAEIISADGKIIVGYEYDNQSGTTTAIMWKDKRVTTLSKLNDEIESFPEAINSNGTIIAGYAHDEQSETTTTAVMWKDGNMQKLSMLKGTMDSFPKAISADGTIIAGYAYDEENDPMKTAIMWKDGNIRVLSMTNDKDMKEATMISADGKIIAGHSFSHENNSETTPVIWNEQGISFLNDYPFQQNHDLFSKMIIVSNNGSDFIVQSAKNKIYRIHIPRRDLWKM